MPETIVSVSGGKDSTAMYTLAIERGKPFAAVFADTGHEHPETVDYVRTLPDRAGGPPIQTVREDFSPLFAARRETVLTKWPAEGVPMDVCERAAAHLHPTGIPFLDLCMLRAGFPAPLARFCTERLKIKPIQNAMYQPVWDRGVGVISWQGIRKDESRARSTLNHLQRLQAPGKLIVYRPLLDWDVGRVYRQHAKHGLEPNPLYKVGLKRVGCFPCIYARKSELRIIGRRWPDHVERIVEWERIVGLVSKRRESVATLYNVKPLKVPTDEIRAEKHGIRAIMDWADNTAGGAQGELIDMDGELGDLATSCGEWGACE